ncbi:MAG: aminotransferase class I/II-fold pyridoxal phosphate-dependent enzyme [Bdellovibrionia bacterium]
MYSIGEEEIEQIRKVIQSRKFFRYEAGRLGTCERFERDFAKKLGSRKALTVTTGTNALIAALGALGVGPGDEVLLPAYTFVATAYAVAAVRAVPVLVNIDEQLGMCPVDMRTKITRRTRAAIVVHMDGQAANMDAIMSVAKAANLKVIEDTAQAIGGKYKRRSLGTIGDIGCFSFNQDKILTCGEGGAIVTKSEELFERCAYMQDGASLFTTRLWNKAKATPFMGGAMRVSEIQGAMLIVQLDRLDGILEKLRERAKIWTEEFEKSELPLKVIRGHDPKGACGTSVVLSFDSIENSTKASRVLQFLGVSSVQILSRPGHSFWEWMELLHQGRMAHHPRLNPLHLATVQQPFQFEKYLPTLEILQKALKINVNYDMSAAQTQRLARKVRRDLEKALKVVSSIQISRRSPAHQRESVLGTV